MKLVAAVLAIAVTFSGVVWGAEIVGGRMVFPAKNGNVLFDHPAHLDRVKGRCTACHKTPGPIDNFGKAYAHDFCISCHQPEPNYPGGPITCEGCHTG